MLVGGHAVVHGQPTIVTAVDQRLSVTITPIDEPVAVVTSVELGVDQVSVALTDIALSNRSIPALPFVSQALHTFQKLYGLPGGCQLVFTSDFSAQVGFGSSSAVTVALLAALAAWAKIQWSPEELFTIAYQVVLTVQGVGSGFDVAAAVWGKTLQYIRPSLPPVSGQKIAEVLAITSLPLVVAYSGTKANTPQLIRQVDEQLSQHPAQTEALFAKIGTCARELGVALSQQDFERAGRILTTHHGLMQQLGMSTPKLDALVQAAISTGAYGATLSGAGGGDCMVSLAPDSKKQAVEQSLILTGGSVLRVTAHAEGVRYD